MTDADFADDQALLANTHAIAEFLLHSIGHYLNANKTELICCKQVAIFTLSGRPLKLVYQFIYLGNSISSTERDVKVRIETELTSSLSII